MTDAKNAENAEKFHCISCDFVCSKKSNYDKHLLTPKHTNKLAIFGDKLSSICPINRGHKKSLNVFKIN